jgi:hypothetical protein
MSIRIERLCIFETRTEAAIKVLVASKLQPMGRDSAQDVLHHIDKCPRITSAKSFHLRGQSSVFVSSLLLSSLNPVGFLPLLLELY